MKQGLIYILFYLFFVQVFAQKDTLVIQNDTRNIELKKFDQKQIEKYKNNKDFNYQIKKSEPSIVSKLWGWFTRAVYKFFRWLFGVEKATGMFSIFLKLMPYVLLAIVLYVLIRIFSKVDFNTLTYGKNKKAVVSLTEEEEIIRNQDISQLIKQAISNKNYRLAVRYYYLLTLQKLEEKELIKWEQQKTNHDYIQELNSFKFNNQFKKLTNLYDFIWYGNFDITQDEFGKVEVDFNTLNHHLK